MKFLSIKNYLYNLHVQYKTKWKARFEVFTAVKIHVEFLWVVTSWTIVVGYQRFRGPCCFHLQGETFVSYHSTTRRRNPECFDVKTSVMNVKRPFCDMFFLYVFMTSKPVLPSCVRNICCCICLVMAYEWVLLISKRVYEDFLQIMIRIPSHGLWETG